MPLKQKAQTRRAATWRKKRKGEGLTQTQVWLPETIRTEIDIRVKTGEFRNRSEFVTAALKQMIGGQPCRS